MKLLRYTLAERVVHWLAAIAYLYLLLTGLAFYSPHLYWIATVLGGGATSRFWHPWMGLLFLATLVWMLRAWLPDMRFTASDRAWGAAVRHYIRNEDEALPPVDRFNAGQKQFFWAMLWAGSALLISGLVLWFPEKIPWNWRALRLAAVLVHVVSALVTIGAFIIHVYMGLAMVRGGFTAMVSGFVTPAWAKMHHRLWYERIVKGDKLGQAHRAR